MDILSYLIGISPSYLIPNFSVPCVKDISDDFLERNGIEAIILDMDRTLSLHHRNIHPQVDAWLSHISESEKYKETTYILTNCNQHRYDELVQMLSSKYPNVKVIMANPKKPNPLAYNQIASDIRTQGKDPLKAIMIGDRLGTDVAFGNMARIISVEVEPLKGERKYMLGLLHEPVGNYIMRQFEQLLLRAYKNNIFYHYH
ncbi:MAG: HAD hydrolase-like protein [archaeon]